MSVPATRAAVRHRFAVVMVLWGMCARQAGDSGGGEGDGVQAPGGPDAHPPGGLLLDFHTPS